ncbi:hypothetical protein SLEP1_g18704 [Rubroshorea leprosula]|uniref:Uncharacterized protein n=1 Tax=Rubroshorea leprosula TaxID=152421 RepID=A0AAV5J7F4_9ROSI|nr:hypothetical protein SLEP1_g18704 [Rubroshorea leprosula]
MVLQIWKLKLLFTVLFTVLFTIPDRSINTLRSSLRFYASEEAKSRTRKNKGSDEVEG